MGVRQPGARSKGGKTNATNCKMLCLDDNRRKGGV